MTTPPDALDQLVILAKPRLDELLREYQDAQRRAQRARDSSDAAAFGNMIHGLNDARRIINECLTEARK